MTKEKRKGSIVKTVIIVLVVFGVLGAVFGEDTKKTTDQGGAEETTGDARSKEENNVQKETKGITNVEVVKENPYGTIDEFDYEISGNEVFLHSFKGKNEILEIKSSYNIGGIDYKTNLSNYQVGIGNSNIKTVILAEGITEVSKAIFNSSDVKKVFFPGSMTNVYDYTLSYLQPDYGELIQIYYAGTQEEWEQIFTEYHSKDISDAESAEEIGSSIADKINEVIGTEYDSSQFEYFFLADPEQLKR